MPFMNLTLAMMKRTSAMRNLMIALAFAATVCAPAKEASAQGAPEALKMEGRKTLYQQVMTRVGARLYRSTDAGSEVIEDGIEPFRTYYVYERKDGWLRVGPSSRGAAAGWLAPNTAIDWKQTIVVAFNNPAEFGRDRTLLFRSREAMDEMIHREDVIARARQLRSEAAAGRSSAGSPIVSIEPEKHVDIDTNFYLFPILAAERQILHFDVRGRYLEVASVALTPAKPKASKSSDEVLKGFRAGIVFAIDTTSSMGPYIERTREAVERIRSTIDRSDIADKVRFGLVGFRQAETISPGIEYHTKTFLKLDEQATAARFTEEIAKMKAASKPTPGFDEDSVGGVVEAVEGANWSPFGARFVVLITDAGPRPPNKDHVRSPMLPEQVNSFLKESHNIIPIVLHLRTPEGKPDHRYAEQAYTAMARGAQGSNYRAVSDGDVQRFQETLDGIASQIVSLTRDSMRGVVEAPAADDNSDAARLRRDWRAMQLAYLGREEGARAPDVFRAWMIDRSLDDPGVEALEVRVLLTKNQLATLRDVARSIVEKAEGGLQRLDPRSFFTQLREAVALLARDPNRLARADFETLGDALGEYLSDLPYDSPITSITEQDWLRRSGPQQRSLIESLKSKIALYERIYNTPNAWIALHRDVPDGERVTTLPLRQMP
jgi:serine/threonine-protein kinase PpkA